MTLCSHSSLNAMNGYNVRRFLQLYWRTLVVIIIPVLFALIPLLNNNEKKFRVLWLLMTMGVLWVTEALPLVVTSTMPIIFLPLMDIMVLC